MKNFLDKKWIVSDVVTQKGPSAFWVNVTCRHRIMAKVCGKTEAGARALAKYIANLHNCRFAYEETETK